MGLYWKRRNRFYIYNLYIFPKYRRKGHAKNLIKKCINIIRNTYKDNRRIQIVADPQEKSINKEDLKKFYKKMKRKLF